MQALVSSPRQLFNRGISTFFVGADLRTWRRVLADNGGAVEAPFVPRAALITAASAYNTALGAREQRRFGDAVSSTAVAPPLILLGHWCSGLAELQRLLSLDDRFACPNLHQVRHPRTFLSTETAHVRLTRWMLPSRHPSDGLLLGPTVPEDDEYALANLTGLSPYMGGLFPRRRAHYLSTYLTLGEAPPDDIRAWRDALVGFSRKLAWKHARPLVLRSPLYTARLERLLDVFPDARFVHVVRDPYAVFGATCRSSAAAIPYNRLQRAPALDVPAFVIDRYTRMYDAFFADRGLVPPGRLCDARFEDIVRDPVRAVRDVYAALDLPAFDRLAPRLARVGTDSAGRDADVGPPLPDDVRRRVASAWRRSFDAWGYPR
jgi:hypothetical protein